MNNTFAKIVQNQENDAISIAIHWKNDCEIDIYYVSNRVETFRGADACMPVLERLKIANIIIAEIE